MAINRATFVETLTKALVACTKNALAKKPNGFRAAKNEKYNMLEKYPVKLLHSL